MIPGNLPFEYPFRWRNEDLAAKAGVDPEAASLLEQRDRDLEDFLATLGGGGGGYAATVTVAASDASAAARANCDFVCDGTNDEDEINAAQAVCFELALAAGYNGADMNAPGGRVLLSEGTFHLQTEGVHDLYTEVGPNGPPNMTLQGQGMAATRFMQTCYDFAVISYGAGYRLCDLSIDGSGVVSEFRNGGLGVYLYGEHSAVERVRFRQVGYQNYANIDMQDAYGLVRDCEFISPQGDATGVFVDSSADFSRVVDNYFYDIPIMAVLSNANKMTVTGNVIEGSQSATTDTDAIGVGANCVVTGNVCESWGGFPATIASGIGCQVANNVLL